jgi:hypothetical protein
MLLPHRILFVDSDQFCRDGFALCFGSRPRIGPGIDKGANDEEMATICGVCICFVCRVGVGERCGVGGTQKEGRATEHSASFFVVSLVDVGL